MSEYAHLVMASQVSRQIKDIVGDNVALARKSKGLTQSELGRRIGVEGMAVSRWERGSSRPSDTNLQAVAEVLGRNFVWFFIDRLDGEAA